MFTLPNMSRVCVTCHMSHVTCHVSHVTCHLSNVTFFFVRTKWWSLLVEGLLSIGPTTSSLISSTRRPKKMVSSHSNIFCCTIFILKLLGPFDFLTPYGPILPFSDLLFLVSTFTPHKYLQDSSAYWMKKMLDNQHSSVMVMWQNGKVRYHQ